MRTLCPIYKTLCMHWNPEEETHTVVTFLPFKADDSFACVNHVGELEFIKPQELSFFFYYYSKKNILVVQIPVPKKSSYNMYYFAL